MCLASLCKAFPMNFRGWAQSLKRHRVLLNRLLERFVTRALFEAERVRIELGQEGWAQDGFVIFCDPDRREFVAEYAKEGEKLAVQLRMEKDYPCSFIAVKPLHGVRLERNVGRMLRMQVILREKNGSVLSAILHWRYTIDKELEGHEVCAICYDIVNPFSKELPRKPCKTCTKKFHSACIVKWLQEKNKNECPLCKGQFN
jgi:hypothetical protein